MNPALLSPSKVDTGACREHGSCPGYQNVHDDDNYVPREAQSEHLRSFPNHQIGEVFSLPISIYFIPTSKTKDKCLGQINKENASEKRGVND